MDVTYLKNVLLQAFESGVWVGGGPGKEAREGCGRGGQGGQGGREMPALPTWQLRTCLLMQVAPKRRLPMRALHAPASSRQLACALPP